MSSFDRLVFREDVRYTKTHEWARKNHDVASSIITGIDDFSQAALGDVVYLELPKIGAEVTAGEMFGSLESTKAVSDLNAPVSGKVVKVNTAVLERPELVNESPFDDAWLIEIAPSNIEQCEAEFNALMDAATYIRSLA